MLYADLTTFEWAYLKPTTEKLPVANWESRIVTYTTPSRSAQIRGWLDDYMRGKQPDAKPGLLRQELAKALREEAAAAKVAAAEKVKLAALEAEVRAANDAADLKRLREDERARQKYNALPCEVREAVDALRKPKPVWRPLTFWGWTTRIVAYAALVLSIVALVR